MSTFLAHTWLFSFGGQIDIQCRYLDPDAAVNVWNVGGTWREHQRLPETPVIKLSFQNFSFQKIWEIFKPTKESESETHKKSESETPVIKFSFQNFIFQKIFAIIKPTQESESETHKRMWNSQKKGTVKLM